MKQNSFLGAAGLLIGSVVGAGFLGIPYVVNKAGFSLGMALIVFLGALVLIQFLSLVEVALRTSGKHQITGYIEKYLGPNWKKLAFILVILEGYGVLLAYMVAEGQVLSELLGGHSLLYSYGFFALVSLIVFLGIKTIEKVDLLLTLAVIAVVAVLVYSNWARFDFANFSGANLNEFFPAYGVILFSFLGAASIPQMRIALSGRERAFAKAVIVAGVIPILIYLAFTFTVLAITGSSTTPIATIGLGQRLGKTMAIIGNLLAAMTMTTSFLGMALALKETFRYDYKYSRAEAWLLTCTVPVILFSFGLHNFIKIIQFVGGVIGGFLGIVLVLVWWQAEKTGDRKPEFVLPFKKFFGVVLIAVYLAGILYTVF